MKKKSTEPKKEKADKIKEPAKKESKSAKEATQPEINIGLVGHVDHGKTTLTEKLSGKWTDTHSEEIKRGITIRLGYADVLIRRCTKCKEYTTSEKCEKCSSDSEILRKISLIDAPGHESLMATMLSGAAIMDGALLLVAANEECPQPQTREHIMALQIVGIKNVIVIQNKIDLVTEEQALKNYKQIKEFLKNTQYKDAPIIPVSAQKKVNIDAVLEAIEIFVPTPVRDPTQEPLMFVARSFDINRPGADPAKLTGGVLGGSLSRGVLKVNDEIEIKPGRKIESHGKTTWQPIPTKITDLKTGGLSVKEVHPGGSIGVLTSLDPFVTKSDSLTGSVVGHKGKLPETLYELTLEPHLLERVVGTREELNVDPIKFSEPLMLNVNAGATVGVVDKLSKNEFHCILKLPVCANIGARVTISRRVGNRFRLIGYGIIKK